MSLSQYGKPTREMDEPRSFPRRDALRAAIQRLKAAGEIIEAEPEPEPFVEMPELAVEAPAFKKTLMRKRRT